MVARRFVALLFLAAFAHAEDRVHLRNGGLLTGKIVEEGQTTITLDVGGGTVTIHRDRIRLLQRGADRTPPRSLTTRRDEWFLVLHHAKVVGWRRFVQTEAPDRITVEERTLFFGAGRGEEVSIHRVESANGKGEPREFLYRESYGNQEESSWGERRGGKIVAVVQRGGKQRTVILSPPEGWQLPLVAWTRFSREAQPGESRTILSLDPRRMRFMRQLLTRGEDKGGGESERRAYRSLSTRQGAFIKRALYRPDEGSRRVELNGSTLVAKRVPKERVDLARRRHARPPPDLERAQNPFWPQKPDLEHAHLQAGVVVTAPDAGWTAKPRDAAEGLVLEFGKLAPLFASMEVFVYPLPGKDADAKLCFERALARLRLTAERVDTKRLEPRDVRIGGLPARVLTLDAKHRGELLRCRLAVVRAKDRYVVLLGACPERWWNWAMPEFESFVTSLKIVG